MFLVNYADGSRFEGLYDSNSRLGKGIFVDISGNVFEHFYEKGKEDPAQSRQLQIDYEVYKHLMIFVNYCLTLYLETC